MKNASVYGASRVVLSLAIATLPFMASAAEFSRQITITRAAGVSVSRPAYPGAQSVFRVYSASLGGWGTSNCRMDAADVSMEDWHLYGVLMRAWKDSLPVYVTVESTIRLDSTDTVCKIVAATVG